MAETEDGAPLLGLFPPYLTPVQCIDVEALHKGSNHREWVMSLFRGEEEKKQKKTVLLDQLALEVRESAGVG